jgi:hypothetical protein
MNRGRVDNRWLSGGGPDVASDPSIVSKAEAKVEVTIPVRQIKSDKKPIDNVMYEAMKQKEHPTIKYREEMTLKDSPAHKRTLSLYTKGS